MAFPVESLTVEFRGVHWLEGWWISAFFILLSVSFPPSAQTARFPVFFTASRIMVGFPVIVRDDCRIAMPAPFNVRTDGRIVEVDVNVRFVHRTGSAPFPR